MLAVSVYLGQTTKIHSEVVELNDKFLDVMNSGMWLVKFYAPYCVHCKRLAPGKHATFYKISKQYLFQSGNTSVMLSPTRHRLSGLEKLIVLDFLELPLDFVSVRIRP